MPIYHQGRKVKEVWHQGRRVKEVWHQGKLVYTARTPITGFEVALDQIDSVADAMSITEPDASKDFMVSSTRSTQVHMLVEGPGSLTVKQDSRTALHMSVSGSTINVVSNGDRGKNNLAFSAPWPGGKHIVSMSTDIDWYGYRLKLLVDGEQVETATNGGAFTLSENVLVSGSATVTASNCVAWAFGASSALRNASTEVGWIKNNLAEGAVSWRSVTPNTIFRVPGGSALAWAYSGGDGGAGGTPYSGGPYGRAGYGAQVPGFTLDMVPSLSIGKGGDGGGGTERRKYNYGGSGKPTTIGGFSTATATTRPTPVAWGSTCPLDLPGKGGNGGSSGSVDDEGNTSRGNSGWSGYPGGLIIARRW
ncbi:hypothetical protein [Corynebacterium timonense]|uniref:Uncharacterized protein n=1 Tax=Corynebacterium timonense TaxID=441500 RepID=A0A1H1LN52_9CORY|nr:hypothetical protein [Corynebacterium timonense]SDR75787.1 hypothetical protein SAMN04488539_0274 [Corynebacterium timonense]